MGYDIDTVAARCATFIEAATAVHGGKYTYENVANDFVNSKIKVEIFCPDHGYYWMPPQDHRRGGSCRECAGRRGSSTAARRELFVRRARKLHGDRYDYDTVVFIDQQTHVTIICADHGEFSQRPARHLDGDNCPSCGAHDPNNRLRQIDGGRYGHPNRTALEKKRPKRPIRKQEAA